MSAKISTQKLYISDNGAVICANHAGYELSGAIQSDPSQNLYFTTLGTWLVAGAHDYLAFREGTGCDLTCEICRDWNFT